MSKSIRIDTLRGLACILLVAYHVVGGTSSLGLQIPDEHWISKVNYALAYLRMPLFCFLSGFVYAWRPFKNNFPQFLVGKTRRLIIPMLIVGTFFAFLQSITPGANSTPIDWRLIHIMPVAHFWFLESLFWIFMFIALLESLRVLDTLPGFAMVWAGAVALFLFNTLPDLLGLAGAAYLLPFFLLGLATNRFAAHIKPPVVWLMAVGVVVLVGLVVMQRTFPERSSLVALLLGTFGCVLLLRSHLESRWLAAVGAYSFAIYLFHTMFTAASRIALTRLGVSDIAVLFASGLFMGMLGPVIVATVLRRVPLGRWALGEKPPSAARNAQNATPSTPAPVVGDVRSASISPP